MNILTEHDTLRYIIKHKCSIARYGDGEFKLCLGRSAKSQKVNPLIKNDLRKILLSNNRKCLVGIPRITSRVDWSSEQKKEFWYKFIAVKKSLCREDKLYGSSFITRPDAAPEIYNKDYFWLLKQIWKDKDVIVVKGEYQKFNRNTSMFSTANKVHLVCEARNDAYKDKDSIINFVKGEVTKNSVVVISLGPTATVIAYELSKLGIQALDLGHLGQYYARVHPKGMDYAGEDFEYS